MEDYIDSFLGFTQISKDNNFMVHSLRNSLNPNADTKVREVNLNGFESLLYASKFNKELEHNI